MITQRAARRLIILRIGPEFEVIIIVLYLKLWAEITETAMAIIFVFYNFLFVTDLKKNTLAYFS